MVKRNFNTCFHSFLKKFVIKVHWISTTFFSFCVFMFSYVLVHVLLYIYIVNYNWFFFKFDVLFFFSFFFFFVLFFYWQAVGALKMNNESFLILFRFCYKFQRRFFSSQPPISRLFTKRSKFVRGARLSTTQRALRRRINVLE